VHNWRSRGIPAAVKVQFPELFIDPVVKAQRAEPDADCKKAA
jgi:hypothetical protein